MNSTRHSTILPPNTACTSLRGAVPELTLAAAALRRIAFDRRFGAMLARLSGGTATLVRPQAASPGALRLRMTSLAGDLMVEIDARQRASLALLAGLAARASGQPLARAVANEWLAHFAGRRSVDTMGLKIQAIEAAPRDDLATQYLPAIEVDGISIRLIEIDDSFGLFASEELRVERVELPPVLRELKLRSFVVFGSRTLPIDVMATLMAGDVVLIDERPPNAEWRLSRQGRTMVAPGELDHHAGRIVLTAAPTLSIGESRMNTDDEAGGHSLQSLELTIRFEVESARLAISEIAALGPGHVICLDTSLDDARIRIVCEGRQIGSGQLIALGDQLGVRIDDIRTSVHANLSH